MKTVLNPSQIKDLFQFVANKNVDLIDVQHEIVDHLASAIEDEFETSPQITFETALAKVYSRFPITGFAQFVMEKEEALKKYWFKKVWSLYLSYFTLPKILLTLTFFLVVYQMHEWLGKLTFFLFFIPLVVLDHLSSSRLIPINKKPNGESYLFITVFFQLAGVSSFSGIILYLSFSNSNIAHIFEPSNSSIMLRQLPSSIYVSLYFIWIHAKWFYYPKMLMKEIETKYQHLKIV